MPAATSDLFALASSGIAPLASTLTNAKSIGAPSFTVAATTGWPTATVFHFKLYQAAVVNSVTTPVSGTETLWSGIISGLAVGSLTLRSGSDQLYPMGSIIEPMLTSAQYDNLITGLLTQHNQNGTHGAITATSLATSAAATVGTTLNVSGASTLAGPITGAGYSAATLYNPYKFAAYLASTTTASGTAAFTLVPIETKVFDTNTNFNTTTFRYTAPVTGFYFFSGCTQWLLSQVNEIRICSIFVNGVEKIRGSEFSMSGTLNVSSACAGLVSLTAGDYVQLFQYSVQSRTLGSSITRFEGFLVSQT